MQRYLDLLRGCAKETSGREVELRGDACLLAFDEVEEALACAVALQRGLATLRADDRAGGLGVRIGLHVGRPIPHDGGFFGRDVILAARLSDAGRRHAILASRAFTHKLDDARRVGRERSLRLKGFGEAQRAARIYWSPREDRTARRGRGHALVAWSLDRLARFALAALPEGVLRSRS
jgi:class 3 adenylate cyclase